MLKVLECEKIFIPSSTKILLFYFRRTHRSALFMLYFIILEKFFEKQSWITPPSLRDLPQLYGVPEEKSTLVPLIHVTLYSKSRPTTDIGLKPAVFSQRVFNKSCCRARRGHTLMSGPTWGVKNVIGEGASQYNSKSIKNYIYRKQGKCMSQNTGIVA